METKPETILCIQRSLLDEFNLLTPGLSFNAGLVLRVIGKFSAWGERGILESDPSYKQIIPYVLVVSGSKILRYRRGKRGGEKRLHDKLSVGIGGHVEESDQSLDAAVRREIAEEIGIACDSICPRAVLNDDSTKVGEVHLGLVYVLHLNNESISTEQGTIVDPEFVEIERAKFAAEEYESWSVFCLQHIDRLIELSKGNQ